MSWIEDALEHIQGADELRSVAEAFMRADRDTQEQALQKLWAFTSKLDGEEKTKFTVMAVTLESAAKVLHERLDD